ncbi:MAG: hypothetical protein CSA36_08090, partial [Draconibacterium sp.]
MEKQFMRTTYIRFVKLLFFLIFTSQGISAQRANGIAIEGKVAVQQGSVEGAVIQMYMDRSRLDNYGIGADGSYKVELNYNHKYELIFTRENNFPQKIVVDATVPQSVLQSNPRFPPFPLDINLFTAIPDIDRSFSENTILKIYYSPNVDNFISEIYYNDAQIAKLIEQAILQSKLVDKESDYLSKLTRAEQAELRREYNELLEQAGKEYSNEQFINALDGYKAASRIFPKEQFPKDRIAEINDLLGLMMAAAELDKAMLERFTKLVKEGDQLFTTQQYQLARSSYNRALSIKPTDNYVNGQVKKIAEILQQQVKDKEYKELIAQGDRSMEELLYNDAIAHFQSALKMKPNETYPKRKIEEINGILAQQAQNAEKQKGYQEAMSQGDANFKKQLYDKALTFYESALSFIPKDETATRKIADTQKLIKEIADRLKFDDLVKSADKYFKKNDFQNALKNYTEADLLLSNDKHVTSQIAAINKILQRNENFASLVSDADNQFNNEKYEVAKSLYQKALEIRNNDNHSSERIKEIDAILAEKRVNEK